jgi:hypothetical protein
MPQLQEVTDIPAHVHCRGAVCHLAAGQVTWQANHLPEHEDACAELLWPRLPGALLTQQGTLLAQQGHIQGYTQHACV